MAVNYQEAHNECIRQIQLFLSYFLQKESREKKEGETEEKAIRPYSIGIKQPWIYCFKASQLPPLLLQPSILQNWVSFYFIIIFLVLSFPSFINLYL